MMPFSQCDAPAEIARRLPPLVREAPRRGGSARREAVTGFVEDVRILFRYAIGRDYYDRRLLLPED